MRYSSHVSLFSTGPALLATTANLAVAVVLTDGKGDEDVVATLDTNSLGIEVSVVVLLDVVEDPELLPDPPSAPPMYSGGPGIVYRGRGLIQLSWWTLSGVYNSVASTPLGFDVFEPSIWRFTHCA